MWKARCASIRANPGRATPRNAEIYEGRRATRLVERVVAVGHSQSDICPIRWPQRIERGRKHDSLLHGHVLLRRVQDHIMLLIKSAHERVATFLLEMSERVSAGNAVELPMSRQDVADYLGLTIETVSRTLSHMESLATIEVPSSRRIVLRNRAALSRLNA
jgi:hypothetical protein